MAHAHATDSEIAEALDGLLGGLCGRLSAAPDHVVLYLLYEEAGPIIDQAGPEAPYVAERVKLMAIDAGLLPRPDQAAHL